MTKATADYFRHLLSSLLAVFLVLVAASAGILVSLLDTVPAIAATFAIAFGYVACLQISARLNASAGSASSVFDKDKFDKSQAAEAKLVALFPVFDEPGGASQVLVAPIISDLQGITQSASRAQIVDLVLTRLGISVAKPEQYYDRITSILQTLQTRIGEEYGDVHTRTGWLMTAQAILLGGFVSVLNAEHMNDEFRRGFTLVIPALGALIAAVLSFAIFHGHELISILKAQREEVEKITTKIYGIPPTGISTQSPVHHYSHLATKVLPAFALVGWSVLLGFAWLKPNLLAPSPTNQVTEAKIQPDAGSQLIALPRSPAFAESESSFTEAKPQCRLPGETDSPEDWARNVVTLWSTRPIKSPRDRLWLVGSTDRMPLSDRGKNRYGSSAGLARARIETIEKLLLAAAEKQQLGGYDAITKERFYFNVAGPQYTPVESIHSDPECGDAAMVMDRAVTVWIALR
jgi:hypothetical protein